MDPQRYRKKPVVVEAMQWPDAESYESVCQRAAIHRWVNGNGHQTEVVDDNGDIYAAVVTLEGKMRIGPGDYVIRGISGEFYPCKPDIFEASYEAVDG